MNDPPSQPLACRIGASVPLVDRRNWRKCLPWLVFAAAIFTTTGIGALTVGLSGGQRWGIAEGRAESLGLDVISIDARLTGSTAYWLVWLLPFALSTAVGCWLWAANRASGGAPSVSPAARREAAGSFIVASALFVAAWTWAAYRYGLLSAGGISSIVDSWSGDLQAHYGSRVSSFESVDFLTTCIAYQGLPALWTYGLLACVQRSDCASQRRWACARLLFMTVLYVILAFAAHQKSLVANLGLLAAFVGVARFGFRYLGWMVMLLAAVALVIHFTMSSMIAGWTEISTVDHITGRTADAYPFAIWRGLHESANGAGVPFWTLGKWVPDMELHMNRTIGDLMYPGDQTFVALAAPTWAFASDGYLGWSIAVLLVLAVLGSCGQLWRLRIPWEDRDVLGIEGMFVAFLLTQVPFVGLIWWSCSIATPLITVLIVRQLTLLTATASTRMRPRLSSSKGGQFGEAKL